ncbi:MAG: acyl-CoA thioesterase [Akkermansiaceae bacterium]|nr:acyl-CoA thioesterase [Akkermansiaceae bacterium]NNM29764.1 acyl-CoA thioesterase [Akkermansiaceae bacterium]
MSAGDTRFGFEVKRQVEFYETDAAGIVHFSNFFRYMETAEHAFLRSLGHHFHEQAGGMEIGWPRVSATNDYKSPVRFGDELVVRVRIAEVRHRSVQYAFECEVVGSDRIAATGEIVTACVQIDADGGFKAVPIPDVLRARLEEAKAASE